MIEQNKIVVWDYHDAIHGSAPWHYRNDFIPVKYEVDAWCLGGKDGIHAFFFINDLLCEARGDDGHWYLLGRMSADWLPKLKEVITSVRRP